MVGDIAQMQATGVTRWATHVRVPGDELDGEATNLRGGGDLFSQNCDNGGDGGRRVGDRYASVLATDDRLPATREGRDGVVSQHCETGRRQAGTNR